MALTVWHAEAEEWRTEAGFGTIRRHHGRARSTASAASSKTR
jgi:hypothetical protein